MGNTRFHAQLLDLPNVHRCCIDNTGIVRQFAERAQTRFGKYKVEAVNFSGALKEELAYPVRTAFEEGAYTSATFNRSFDAEKIKVTLEEWAVSTP